MDAQHNSALVVTGGRGFVGRAVVKRLRDAGRDVVSLDTTATADDADCDEIQCDITSGEQLQRVFASRAIGGVVHLAAILPTAAQREPVRATQVNVDGSLLLLEMARESGVPRFVFGSSLSIYGTHGADRVVSESERAAPEDLYGAAKLYVERLGEAFGKGGGKEFVSLRIGRVVGAGARSATSAWRSEIFEYLGTQSPVEIEVPYAGTERILVVHVDDLAEMLVRLAIEPQVAHAVYNAPCESILVGELKDAVEALNSNIVVRLGDARALGNPQKLNAARFEREFDFRAVPIFEQLRRAAKEFGAGTSSPQALKRGPNSA